MSIADATVATQLGDYKLDTPLVASCGTVGSVVDFAGVADLGNYGAAVAKSVSGTPWPGRRPPRLAGTGAGRRGLNNATGYGPAAWVDDIGPRIDSVSTDVWGSAVGNSRDEFAKVAGALTGVGVTAIEVNLSCPNLEDGKMFALDPAAAASVIAAVREATPLPVGAKLTPNSEDIVAVAAAVSEAGADWVVLGNTVWGAGFDIETRRPLLSGVVGGYSGKPIKPIALRCVWQVSQALPELPIVGSGGVTAAEDVVEFLLAGASAVGVGTAHFASPRIGSKIMRDLRRYLVRHGEATVQSLVGAAEPW